MLRELVVGLIAAVATTPSLAAQGRVVNANGAPSWGANVRLVPALTVGTVDGPPEYALGSVDRVAGEKNGGFFVYDSRYSQIRRYDASGKHLANIGRKGSGPGEYQQLLGMAVLGDSLLVTWDPQNARATFFGFDGAVRSSFTARLGGVSFGPDVFGIDNDGNVSVLVGFRATRAYIRYRANGTVLDTLAAPLDAKSGFTIPTNDGVRSSFGRGRILKPNTSGGLITASTDTLGFAVVGGSTPLRVTRTHAPMRLGAAERKEWETFAEGIYNLARRQRPQPGAQRTEVTLATIPTLKPALRDFVVDRDGRVWLDVYTTAEKREMPPRRAGDTRPQLTWRERSTFEVFAASGQYLGRVVLPAEHQFLDARGDRVWAYTSGPDGEERIMIFQIARR